MKVLVVNAGSSSLKYQLFDMTDESVLAKGIAERIGIGGIISGKTHDGRSYKYEIEMKDHIAAFNEVQKNLVSGECAVIKDMNEISAVGHRVVQGGALFDKSVLVDEKVMEGIKSLIDLAPLHNAAHLIGNGRFDAVPDTGNRGFYSVHHIGNGRGYGIPCTGNNRFYRIQNGRNHTGDGVPHRADHA